MSISSTTSARPTSVAAARSPNPVVVSAVKLKYTREPCVTSLTPVKNGPLES